MPNVKPDIEPCSLTLEWDRAGGPPACQGRFKACPEDFRVTEILGFEPDGSGGHVWLELEKTGMNTDFLARRLARIAGVPARAIGYSGLKDRQAVTRQWFSIDLAGRAEPDWTGLEDGGVRLLTRTRSARKLRRGSHRRNAFVLVLRDLRGDAAALEAALGRVRDAGVPNYFGAQRFGREGGNLAAAAALFSGDLRLKDRHRRGLYLSAARAWLFNQVLSRRVGEGSWNRLLPGEAVVLDGTHSFFPARGDEADLQQRLVAFDIHPSGPLWGRGVPGSEAGALALETEVLGPCESFRVGLEAAGLRQERRALRLRPGDMTWEFLPGQALRLAFSLPAGAYATSVLGELIELV